MSEQEKKEEKEALVESALFLASRFLSLQELEMYTNINPISLKETITKLQEKYEKHDSLTIINKENKYKMDVKPQYTHLINKLASGSTEFSKAEQETLAIIAYKQPITQSIVVKIRGNKAYNHVRHLREVGLIKTKKIGRTLSLKLDESFYDYFNLKKE